METVTLEVAGGVAWVTLDRPEVMNAFDARMQEELSQTWRPRLGAHAVLL